MSSLRKPTALRTGVALLALVLPAGPRPAIGSDGSGVAGAQTVDERPPAVRLTGEQEARARALDAELRCPVCRSQSIRQSRSFMAEDMKTKVRELIAAGRTDVEVRDYFVSRYGEWILLTPPRRGFNLAAFLPLIVVAAGAAGLALAGWRWSRSGITDVPPEPLPRSRHLARLEREIEESDS